MLAARPGGLVALVPGLLLAAFIAAPAQAREGVCRTTEVKVTVGSTLRLDCRVGTADRVKGSCHRTRTTVCVKPKRGSLARPTKASRAVYAARTVGRGVCQLVSATANQGHDSAGVQVFGRNRTHAAPGVHAPN